MTLRTTPKMNSVLTIFLATTWCDIWTIAFVSAKALLHTVESPQINNRSHGTKTLTKETMVSPSLNLAPRGWSHAYPLYSNDSRMINFNHSELLRMAKTSKY